MMLTVPGCAAVPVAVSCVDELKTVGSAAPFQRTCAPLTKRLPATLSVKGPRGMGVGLRLVVHGI